MAVPPNRLRYVDCALPDGLSRAIIEFEDWFDLQVKPYWDQLDEFKKLAPGIKDLLTQHANDLNNLVEGAPVKELSSLENIEKFTKLSNPLKDQNSDEVKRDDEQKLGAAGIVMINGRPFAKKNGTRLKAVRQLWEAAGGNYQSFIALGNAITALPTGGFYFLEYNPITKNFPYIGKSFSQMRPLSGYGPSLFKHRVIWNNEVGATTATRTKLEKSEFTDDQISSTLAGDAPNTNYDFKTALTIVTTTVNNLTQLITYPETDPTRQPAWEKETDAIELALREYLNWRTHKNTTAEILDKDYWNAVIINLSEAELKELLEFRTEINDMDIPSSFPTIKILFEKAMDLDPGSTAINTYMINLPSNETSETEFTQSLYDLGLEIWKKILNVLPQRANTIESLLLELTGVKGPLDPVVSQPYSTEEPSMEDLKTVYPNVTAPGSSMKSMLDSLAGGSSLIWFALKANAKGAYVLNAQDKIINEQALQDGNATGSGNTQGLQTEESFAMILARRTKWGTIGMECNGTRMVELPDEETGEPVSQVVDTTTGEVLESPSGLSAGTPLAAAEKIITDGTPLDTDKFAAKDRRVVEDIDNGPVNSFSGSFEINCVPFFESEFTKRLAKLWNEIEDFLKMIITAIKEIILYVQDILDALIITFQLILNDLLAMLEKVLTIDVNFSGGIGIENSLIKCSWNLDFGLKIDLLSILLNLLGKIFDAISAPLQKFFQWIQDLVNKVFCIPIKFLESILSNPVLNQILAFLGCTIKDIQLPDAILDLLDLLNASLDLRGIVLKKGADDWLDLSLGLKKQGNEFTGLSQFAAYCANPTSGNVVNNMVDVVGVATSDLLPDASVDTAVKALVGVTS